MGHELLSAGRRRRTVGSGRGHSTRRYRPAREHPTRWPGWSGAPTFRPRTRASARRASSPRSKAMNFERHAVAVPTWKCLMLAVLAVCTLVTSRVDAAPPSRPLTIDAARALPLGSRVTVEGSVTTPSGAFASSFFDVGFGLQDRSAGIYVSLQTNPGLSPGDQVRVTGV